MITVLSVLTIYSANNLPGDVTCMEVVLIPASGSVNLVLGNPVPGEQVAPLEYRTDSKLGEEFATVEVVEDSNDHNFPNVS